MKVVRPILIVVVSSKVTWQSIILFSGSAEEEVEAERKKYASSPSRCRDQEEMAEKKALKQSH